MITIDPDRPTPFGQGGYESTGYLVIVDFFIKVQIAAARLDAVAFTFGDDLKKAGNYGLFKVPHHPPVAGAVGDWSEGHAVLELD